jgi:hypothetical protein
MKASKVTIFGNHLVDFSVKLEFSYFVLGFFLIMLSASIQVNLYPKPVLVEVHVVLGKHWKPRVSWKLTLLEIYAHE